MMVDEVHKIGHVQRQDVTVPRISDEVIERARDAFTAGVERAFAEAGLELNTDDDQAEPDPHEWDLPEVTTEQAAALFDVSPDLIAKWKHRRQLVPVGLLLGRGRGGQAPVYRTSEVAELASAYHRRRAARAARIAARATPNEA